MERLNLKSDPKTVVVCSTFFTVVNGCRMCKGTVNAHLNFYKGDIHIYPYISVSIEIPSPLTE